MNTYAYDASLPCKNPNCGSNGTPHPNCKCYGYAEGGDVGHYCAGGKAHMRGCEYYADGGSIVPDSDVQVDASIPDEEVKLDSDTYTTPGQQVLAGIEGAARGVTAGLSDTLAKPLRSMGQAVGINPDIMAPKPEEMAARQEQNPVISRGAELGTGAAGFVTGAGAPGLIAKTATKATELANLGRIGGVALKSAIESGLLQSSNEVSQAILSGKNPEAAVSGAMWDVPAAMLLGGMFGTATGLAKPMTSAAAQRLESLESDKINSKMRSFLAGVGAASKGAEEPSKEFFRPTANVAGKYVKNKMGLLMTPKEAMVDVHMPSFDAGAKWFKTAMSEGSRPLTLVPFAEKIIGKVADKTVTPVLLRAISAGEKATNIVDVIKYAKAAGKGHEAIERGVDAIFKGTVSQAIRSVDLAKEREKLRSLIEENKIGEELAEQPLQGYAKGGEVKSTEVSPIAQHLPEQNMLIQAARGRVYSYLNSIRPQPPMGQLPYDGKRKDTQAKREYDKVLDLANQPSSVLGEIKKGTLTKKQLQHFTALYPEMHGHLSKRLTEKITQQQMAGEKIPYKTRQALGIFLGAPLDSSMKPQNIMAAQAAFARAKAGAQQAQQGKGSSTLAKASNSLKTPLQANEFRDQAHK